MGLGARVVSCRVPDAEFLLLEAESHGTSRGAFGVVGRCAGRGPCAVAMYVDGEKELLELEAHGLGEAPSFGFVNTYSGWPTAIVF